MKKLNMIVVLSLLLSLMVSFAISQDIEERYSLWVGSHYTDFDEYAKKIGEFRRNVDKEGYPEFKADYYSRSGSSISTAYGHFFDRENINAAFSSKSGDRFKVDAGFRSLSKQAGNDLLENINAREWLGTKPGGKTMTHTSYDEAVGYATQRSEFKANMEVLLNRKNNIRMMVAHRLINETGNEQKIGSNHCFSCHLTSQEVKVDRRTQSLKAGLDATVAEHNVGYQFGYRKFQSKGEGAGMYYDDARHPVKGSSGAEFGSRLNYEDAALPFQVYPETEKMSHKLRSKGTLGKVRYAAALTYSQTTNQEIEFLGVDLESKALSGNLNVTMPVNNRVRVIARTGLVKLENDDPFIDLPTYRDYPTAMGPQTSFDYVRKSSLDRTNFDGSLEFLARVNPKLTVSVLGGYDYVNREDYPIVGEDNTTSKMIGQLKIKYREGLKFSFRGKYRYEKINDPFVSAIGLFERRGREELAIPSTGFRFVFYFQREGLKYQDITTEPTQVHNADVSATFNPTNKASLMLGMKAMFDKNSDLDSLDVKHSNLQPNVNLTLTPTPQWVVASGYTGSFGKSRGPIAVALFDG